MMLSFGHFYFASLDLYENSTHYPKQTKHLPDRQTNKQITQNKSESEIGKKLLKNMEKLNGFCLGF